MNEAPPPQETKEKQEEQKPQDDSLLKARAEALLRLKEALRTR